MSKFPIVVDLAYNYEGGDFTEEELLLLQFSTSAHFPFLNKFFQFHGVRVLNSNYSKKINEVNYHFFKGRPTKLWWPLKMHQLIASLNPDVILLHGFSNPLQVLFLRLQTKATLIVQYHGCGAPAGITGGLQKLLKHLVKHYIFTGKGQAVEFIEKGLISNRAHIYEVPEGSTHKKQIEKSEARKSLSLGENETVFLWVGRLDKNKDPLTVLEGLNEFLTQNANTRLVMVFQVSELLKEVKQYILNHPLLNKKITLVGEVPHTALDAYYSSADYFVLGSHYEGSGYALIEAMACGCIPLVTDIPSFKNLTHYGQLGALWQPGNSKSLKVALEKVLKKDTVTESKRVVDFFEQELSFAAIAQKQAAMITEILSQKNSSR